MQPGASREAFAIWITGLPASGKSTLAAELKNELALHGIDVAVLESDQLRKILTPHPRYDDRERQTFYHQLAYIGSLLAAHGVPVIFDATANRRAYRDEARGKIRRFLEVYLDCPLELCVSRDPKGIYRAGRAGPNQNVPGLQASYEPPENPDIVIHAGKENPQDAARRVVALLREKDYL